MTNFTADRHEAQLQQTLLKWDYFDLQRKAKKGLGPNASLTNVPDTFESLKVRVEVVVCTWLHCM